MLKLLFFSKRSHIRQALMDVIFGLRLEVPMYQNQKVKCEPMGKTSHLPSIVTVSKV